MPTPFRTLTPDAQYHDDAVVERAAANGLLDLVTLRERGADAIPDAEWQAAEAILLWHECPIAPDLVPRLKKCRIIVRCGAGFDHVDLKATGAAGIPVCNVPDYGTSEVADHAMALMLTLRRNIVQYNDRVRADPVAGFDWSGPATTIRRIRGQSLGIVGLGRIGTATALRAKAFGLSVLVYDPYLPWGQEIALGITRMPDLHSLLAQSDIVSLNAPLTEETHHIIDAAAFSAMKPEAVLVNTARGGLIDLDALHAALKDGRIAAAGLDVMPQEPPEPDHPLMRDFKAQPDWIKGRLIVTPHAAWYSVESQTDA
ncbi:MAG: C-terminal binding protein, partial [Alphaproteobacteria bacterium]|nr:C-terminal binding protein [Alphaproteobacteria bacterium]